MLAATDQRVSTKLRAARITGTPTIVLLENEKVLVRWTGQITPVEEKAVISQVDGSVHTLSEVGNKARPIMRVVEVSAATPDPIFSRAPIVDLSPRNASVRSRVARAVNLPFDELSVRMYIELPMDGTPVVLDCTVTEEGACRAHALMMKDSGFTNIWLYDAGALGATCNSTTTP
jgi:hypothetical protein